LIFLKRPSHSWINTLISGCVSSTVIDFRYRLIGKIQHKDGYRGGYCRGHGQMRRSICEYINFADYIVGDVTEETLLEEPFSGDARARLLVVVFGRSNSSKVCLQVDSPIFEEDSFEFRDFTKLGVVI
jgi:hypothetical protein